MRDVFQMFQASSEVRLFHVALVKIHRSPERLNDNVRQCKNRSYISHNRKEGYKKQK